LLSLQAFQESLEEVCLIVTPSVFLIAFARGQRSEGGALELPFNDLPGRRWFLSIHAPEHAVPVMFSFAGLNLAPHEEVCLLVRVAPPSRKAPCSRTIQSCL